MLRGAAAATLNLVLLRIGISALVTIAAAASLAPAAVTARSHDFRATYTGGGAGQLSGTRASGSATAKGRANVLGRSTLSGAAFGVLKTPTCLSFDGDAVLEGRAGAIKVVTRGAQACIPTAAAGTVAFSGSARVTGGTKKFSHARGRLTFHGVYAQSARTVKVSFKGRVTY